MESVLNPPPNGDDATVPDTDPTPVTDERPTSDETVNDVPVDQLPADHPDHESAHPPEVDPAMTFADLKLMRPLMDAISAAGYTHPTPIQEAVIPPALRAKDVIGQAQTGTGKTAAFLIPFLNRWRPHTLKGPIGVVMTPTRELALQIATEAEKLAPSSKFRCVPVYGGTGMQRQLDGLARGCDLIVGKGENRRYGTPRGHTKLGVVQHRDIVLSVAEGDQITFRPPQLSERAAHTDRLIDPAGENHQRRAVENHLRVEAKAPNQFENFVHMLLPGADDDGTGMKRHALSPQLAEKMLRRRFADLNRAADATKINHRAILGYDRVER